MTKTNEIKEDFHYINGIIGRMGFSIDELQELEKNEEPISKETLDELTISFEELKKALKALNLKL